MAEGIVLPVCLLLLVGLLMKSRRACSGETEQRQESSGKERTVGLLLVLLVALMTCVFSTLDNAVTLVHSSGETSVNGPERCWQALWERRRSRCTNSGKSGGNDPSAAIGGIFLIAETACRFW